MQIWNIVGVLVISYIFGAIPFGLIVVWIGTGQDVRSFGSGRTGGTNAMRAAGILAGVMTGVLDIVKGAGAIWIARALVPGNLWVEILAPIMAIMGHNYSVFLLERGKDERLRFGGGAGGATCVGGAFGLWPPIIFILLPLAFLIWYGIGYASVTTMAIALITTIIFAIRASLGLSPWIYVLYGILSEIILVWALRPNLIRLRNGTERVHGWRARRQKDQSQNQHPVN